MGDALSRSRRKPSTPAGPTPVEAIRHEDKRVNIPTADAHDLVDPEVVAPKELLYPRDPSLDPQLVWQGKDVADRDDLHVTAPPLYIQEKIDPQVLVENLRRTAARPEDEPELALFESFDGLQGFQTIEHYRHQANWSNRMILGDSLQVMGSLAEREDLRGKVQMIYLDPPYGIKFGSNWQVHTNRRDVKDGKLTDVAREVEVIKAFRDTWEKGIHSYLSYLRDRFVVARDLLTESGSIFVQIGDENVHLVRSVLDEVFGSDNFCSSIAFKKTTGAGSPSGYTDVLPAVFDTLLWYAKDLQNVRYRRLFRGRSVGAEGATQYTWILTPEGDKRAATSSEIGDPESRIFAHDNLTSQTGGVTTIFPVDFQNRIFRPAKGGWKTTAEGMHRLRAAGRLMVVGNSLRYLRFHSDFPLSPRTNLWEDTVTSGFGDPKVYVVQTNSRVIERSVLMTTEPGDLVLDPTCGSGTTAYVAEQWGRRWITIDTSRVAIALARQRIMGAKLPYYLLADTPQGATEEARLSGVQEPPPPSDSHRGDVRKGFVYERVPHVTLKSIANNPDIREGMSREEIDAAIAKHADTELLYDRPREDKKRVRVAGPFTVESLSPHRSIGLASDEQEDGEVFEGALTGSSYEQTILGNLDKAGVQNGRRAERLKFELVEPFPGRFIQAVGTRKAAEEGTPESVAIALGPEYGTVTPDLVKHAAQEALRGAGHDLLLVLGFAFDPQALDTAQEFRPTDTSDFATVAGERRIGKLPVLLVRMNSDLAMGDVLLKKTGSGNLFTVFGEPDIEVEETEDGIVVRIRGIDVYDPTTGEIRSSGDHVEADVAMWMIDTDYDGESFFVRHCYFAGRHDPYARLKKALKADIDEAAWESLYSTSSRPFPKPETGRIAVKAINHYGDEVLVVRDA
jgi:adenine-specific DNA-methyltransferase